MVVRDQVLFGAAGAALIAAALSVWLLLAAPGNAPSAELDPGIRFAGSAAPASDASPPTSLLVDVEGGVAQPGIVELPSGSRVGDAIAAAGGYAKDADVLAASASLNLASALTDGQQVYVPIVGATKPASAAGGTGGGGSSLVAINTATPEELDALPGIGPVTVQKIVAARDEQPFTTLEELVERKVLNNGQLDKIRDLATV
jgi:competence protein ComEA